MYQDQLYLKNKFLRILLLFSKQDGCLNETFDLVMNLVNYTAKSYKGFLERESIFTYYEEFI